MLKKPVSKAAASEGLRRYSRGYVEGLNDARTKLAGFFSIQKKRPALVWNTETALRTG
jgi:hypothetical protein